MFIETSRLQLLSCTAPHIEALIAGAAAFEAAFGLKVMEGYLEFPEALAHLLIETRSPDFTPPWGSLLFIHPAAKALIGLGGFKGAPSADGRVEIGYGVAHAYRQQGYAREAAQGMVNFAWQSPQVQKVWAHTLAQENASVKILRHLGFARVAELREENEEREWNTELAPEDIHIWRWELLRQGTSA